MFIDLISIFALSFFLGIRHATDADHIVAVTNIITQQQKGVLSSALVGVLWGIGHSAAVTLIGVPIIFYALVIPPAISIFAEFAVGVMLTILGVFSITGVTSKFTLKFSSVTIHKHPNSGNQNTNHSHTHLHIADKLKHSLHHLGIFQIFRPIAVGMVHGLAGSSIIALLILSTIHKLTLAAFYLFIFHIGVLTGMVIVTTGIGASLVILRKKNANINHYLVFISGFLSLLFGLYIMYQTGLEALSNFSN